MRTTNDQVIPVFLKTGEVVENTSGSFRALTGKPGYVGGYYSSDWLTDRLANIVNTRRENIRAVIYSYSTPIAWLDGDVWVVPDAKYSATTSTKHATHLWKLPNRVWIPADCGVGDEYEAFISRRSRYTGSSVAAAR